LAFAAKRCLDATLAAAGLALSGPLLLGLAVAVRLQDGGPAWFTQTRVGRYGRTFRLVKLRTMVPGAEDHVDGLRPESTVDGPAFKHPSDPRITRLGRFLRRWSLDELPQLVNVLQGDMSLVGPRPPLPDEVARYEPWQLRRLSVRPGMTGLWQVSGRADLPFVRWMELDLQYVDAWSLWLDLVLLARTLPAVLTGTGAR
jgi:lipopolysaccharide/colanic/teichoic acid biosynthesis glycosyltransferase